MPIVHLVRHGRAAAGFEGHLDPGLDAVGRSQAEAAAVALAQEFKTPVPIYTSPLARARETAAPLAERWGVTPIIEPRGGRDPRADNGSARTRPLVARRDGGAVDGPFRPMCSLGDRRWWIALRPSRPT